MLFPLTHTACPVNLEKEEKKWTEASESEENTREDYTTRDTEAETKRQREREGDGDRLQERTANIESCSKWGHKKQDLWIC